MIRDTVRFCESQNNRSLQLLLIRRAEIPGAKSPRRMHAARWRLISRVSLMTTKILWSFPDICKICAKFRLGVRIYEYHKTYQYSETNAIHFIENQGPLHFSSITCSSSGGDIQTAFGNCNCNSATANRHYTHAIYQIPFV
jgi:hypothetical protein